VSISLKNEIDPPSIDSSLSLDLINVELILSLDLINIESILSLDLVNVESNISLNLIIETSFHLHGLVDHVSSYGEHLPISNQDFNQIQKLMTT
jgi:hypothetical protein